MAPAHVRPERLPPLRLAGHRRTAAFPPPPQQGSLCNIKGRRVPCSEALRQEGPLLNSGAHSLLRFVSNPAVPRRLPHQALHPPVVIKWRLDSQAPPAAGSGCPPRARAAAAPPQHAPPPHPTVTLHVLFSRGGEGGEEGGVRVVN